MILNSPKFRLKIIRVLFLTMGWVAAGIYISTLKHLSIIIGHGTVDHTYSEINKYNQKLIVSKDLLELIKLNEDLSAKEIGQMNLRGRSAPIILYSVKKNKNTKIFFS